MDLNGKVCVVTGASRGIGKEFSKGLVNRGATVVGIGRSKESLASLQQELGENIHGYAADVSKEDQIESVFDKIENDFGKVDVLINNAGVGRFEELQNTSTEDWDIQIDVNLKGVYLCTRRVIPIMKAQNEKVGFGGHIVNIASIAGIMGVPKLSIYNATKFGLRGMSESLMKELRYDGIKVTCLFPGSIQTEFFDNINGMDAHSRMMQPEDVASTVMHVLEVPDNYLISEVVMRPFRPKKNP